MGFFINEHRDFSGNAADLANIASQCAHQLRLPGDPEKINERTIRYYVAERLVERPQRIGRDAQYGYTHLLQFLAGRFLVESGYPIQKLADYLTSESQEKLEIMLMTKRQPNMAEFLVASFQRGGAEREGRSRNQRIFTTEVDINKRDFRKMNRSDEDRSGVMDSISLPSNMSAPAFSKNLSISEMHSVDSGVRSAASARDHLDLVQSQIDDLNQSMQQQFNRICDEMNRERARAREEHEQERLEWRKEREALQQKIDQLIAIVAKQNKGRDDE